FNATATSMGKTSAYLAREANVAVGSLAVLANTPDRKATSSVTAGAVGLLGGGAGIGSSAAVSGDVRAYLGLNPVVTTRGGVKVTAQSLEAEATTTAKGGSGSIIGNGVNFLTSATTGGTVSAGVQDGAQVKAGSLVVLANGTDKATPTTDATGFGAIVDVVRG